MRQATRRFLKIRPNAQLVSVQQRPHPESREGECHENAFRESQRSGSEVCPGWVISPYRYGFTAVMFHFWNYDPKTGEYYDTTPGMTTEDYDYVEDPPVYHNSRIWSKTVSEQWWFLPPSIKLYDRDRTVSMAIATHESSTAQMQWLGIQEREWGISELMQLRHQANPYC